MRSRSRHETAGGDLLGSLPTMHALRVRSAVLTVVTAVAVVGQADLLAALLSRGITGDERTGWLLLALCGAFALRAAAAWAQATSAHRSAAAVKADLRGRLLASATTLGPVRLARWRHGELATLLTRGLDALDPYLTSYVPRTVAMAVVPVLVVTRLAVADWVAAVTVVVTLPLVPVFGALVGAHTRQRTARRWASLSRLGGHFADVLAGLPTLRAFGRARHEEGVVRELADAHRTATMSTLRVAFLSSLVLETVATLSIALVAVPAGLRLLAGEMDLRTALLVLFLTPEAYLPLRAAGAAFHDSAEGREVAEQAAAVLRTPPPRTEGVGTVRTSSGAPSLAFDRVTARYPGTDSPAVRDVTLRVAPGERIALVGPSGAGKSSLLALVLGFLPPTSGRLSVDDVDVTTLDLDAWRRRLAWVPQRPHLLAASVADNIRLGDPSAPDRAVEDAARAAAVDEFVPRLPEGYATMLGEGGAGLSAGQRQRIALARAFLRDAPLLLLDEPTAHLDPTTEATVVAATTRLMEGRTTVVVAHRPGLLPHVDRVVHVSGGRVDGVDRSAALARAGAG